MPIIITDTRLHAHRNEIVYTMYMDVTSDWLVKLVDMKLIASTSQGKRFNAPYVKNGSQQARRIAQVNANY